MLSRAPISPRRYYPRRLAAWLLCLLGGYALHANAATEPMLSVFVSVLPLQGLVEHVGGGRVAVQTLVQPGQSPHSYEPTPRQIAALAEADLFVRTGVGFEAAAMPRIQAANPTLPILDLRDGLPLRTLEAHDHDADEGSAHERGHGHRHDHAAADSDGEMPDSAAAAEALDPHVWTSPPLVRRMAVAIRDRLTELDPAGAAVYAANQRRFDSALVGLDIELRTRLGPLRHRRFLVYHPAWGYFAEAYGLTQIPIEREGKAPAARRLADLIDQARANDIRVIFVQPQFDRRMAERVAREIGGQVVSADPLAADLFASLRHLADLFIAANAPASMPADARTDP
ncbi:MAG: ABC transporter substrate-binding protein [Chromatiaceae bacterium]|nr:MAG: ABC transporter substrate-binding protein [Chromatiaceae bacterium]